MKDSSIELTIRLTDPDLDDDERDLEAQRLLTQIQEDPEVISAKPAADHNGPPENSKAGEALLVGALVIVYGPRIKDSLRYLADRLTGKSIEMELEVAGKKLKVKAANQAELESAIQAARELLA
uniref:Uncharacterized protein n=1 Tax=Candidatus Kentrum sp. FW TaxID=2126338 RepID=A0A450SPA8_9GAMM|nr:MAG: hypothetical protein BECKFW1821B_GA0114236_10243 [Candidatus Kentron sp. FW]VFJ58614.1 MAG: hypothetical protein BECKFW1821A_GA0114235_10843 [Candidatus Kentron sp. FW]